MGVVGQPVRVDVARPVKIETDRPIKIEADRALKVENVGYTPARSPASELRQCHPWLPGVEERRPAPRSRRRCAS